MSELSEAIARVATAVAEDRISARCDHGTLTFDDIRTLLAALSDPSKLLREPVWEKIGRYSYIWKTPLGRYDVSGMPQACHWYAPREQGLPCDSLEAGQAACRADFVSRMLPALIGGSDA